MKSKNEKGLKIFIRSVCLVTALVLPSMARSDDVHNMPNGATMMGPAAVPNLSLPLDCSVIDDELTRIDKFSHNPKATKIQLDANAARAGKLRAKRKKMECPAAVTH